MNSRIIVVLSIIIATANVGCLDLDDSVGDGRTGVDSKGKTDGAGECPDPGDPRVSYIDDAICDDTPVRFLCGDEEESFDDECGCGCIAPVLPGCPDPLDPDVTYLDDALCDDTPVRFLCGDEEQSFDNECGCGCIASELPLPVECPDPDDPRVSYIDDAICDDTPVRFLCGDEEESFDDECGCGCIAPVLPGCPDPLDPDVTYLDDALCDDTPVRFLCGDEEESFHNECGCGCIAGPGIEVSLASLLTEQGGCGDIFLYAHDEGDTVDLTVSLPQLIDEARRQDVPATFSYSLPHPEVTVESHVGTRVSMWACNDAISPDQEPVIDETHRAVAGTIVVTVTPEAGEIHPWSNPATVTAVLTDVVLESAEAIIELGPMTLADIYVGWLPG